jgi:Prolyl oligopeptidase, N-terminal beta-propeller domain
VCVSSRYHGPIHPSAPTEAKYNYITNVGDKFYMLTSLGAPKMKVVSMTLPAHGSLVETDPAALAALPVDVEVAECDDTLEGVVCVARTKLVFAYLHDVVARLEYRDPAPGTAYLAESRPEINTLLFKYTSFVHAGTILRMDFSTETVDAYVYHDTVVPGLDPNDFEAFQDFAVSKCVYPPFHSLYYL